MLYCLGRPKIHPLGFACLDTGPTARRARNIARGCNPINAKMMVWPFDGRMALSRRDRLIVARHEVPGNRCKEGSVPGKCLAPRRNPPRPRRRGRPRLRIEAVCQDGRGANGECNRRELARTTRRTAEDEDDHDDEDDWADAKQIKKDNVPEGRLKSLSVSHLSRDRFNRPAGTGLFSS